MPVETSTDPRGGLRKAAGMAWRWLASMQLAVCLIVLLAAVLAWATLLEADRGRAYAQWRVYQSSWFFALLTLLGTNILAATIVRFPWRRKISFLITHAGLLALLAGSIQSFWGAIEGQVAVAEGETASQMTILDRSQFTVRWEPRSRESRGRQSGVVAFTPGPVDWPDGKTLDMGQILGVGLKLVKFYGHAVSEELYLDDPSGRAGPAVQLALLRSDGARGPASWLAARPADAELRFGPIEIKLLQAADNSKLQEFLHPPAKTAETRQTSGERRQAPIVEFLHTPDGQLACRTATADGYRVQGVVKVGDRVELVAGFKLEIVKYLPHAFQEVRFHSIEPQGERDSTEAAAQVEVTVGGSTRRLWLQRNDPSLGQQAVVTPEGSLVLSFGYETAPLGFSLRLLKFTRGLNPGGMGNASFASSVEVIDPRTDVAQKHEISMNEPLTQGKLTFYQSSYRESPGSPPVSFFSVAYDPGLALKYLGSLMICLGTAMMFLRRVRLNPRSTNLPAPSPLSHSMGEGQGVRAK